MIKNTRVVKVVFPKMFTVQNALSEFVRCFHTRMILEKEHLWPDRLKKKKREPKKIYGLTSEKPICVWVINIYNWFMNHL